MGSDENLKSVLCPAVSDELWEVKRTAVAGR